MSPHAAIVIGVFTVVCGTLVYALWRGVRGTERVGESACARCRYPVNGLATFTCPECGSDLRSVGIVAPGMKLRKPLGLAVYLVMWTALTLIAGVPLMGLALMMLPEDIVYQRSVTLTPDSGAAYSASLDIKGEEHSGITTARECSLLIAPATGAGESKVRTKGSGGRCEITVSTAGEATLVDNVDEGVILKAMAGAGIEVNAATARAEARELAEDISDSMRAPLAGVPSLGTAQFTSGGLNSSTRQGPPIWGMVVALAVLTGVWAVGSPGTELEFAL